MTGRLTKSAGLLLIAFAASTAQAEESVDPAKLFQQGRWREAADAYTVVVENEPENQTAWYQLGYSLHALGEIEEALAAHETAAGLPGPGAATAAYNASCAHSLLGHVDKGCEWLGKAVAAGFGSGTQLDVDPDLEALRDDPRYLAVRNPLVRRTLFRTFRGAAEPGNPRQFDFWIGDWDTTNFSLSPIGSWSPAGSLASRVFPVLGGRALVEWSEGTNPGNTTQGFSLRTYDPGKDEWSVLLNWPNKDRPSFSVMTGQFRLGRCEIVSPWSATPAAPAASSTSPSAGGGPAPTLGTQTRFTFADSGADRYRWDMARTVDSGRTWNTSLIFEGRRRASDAPALTTGPSTSNSLCSGAVFREFDFLLGTWNGERVAGPVEGRTEPEPVRVHAYSVMEGSAIVDETIVGAGDDVRREFAIRCYELARSAWVRYALHDESTRFERHQGRVSSGPIVMRGAPGPGSAGSTGTITWERQDDGRLVRERTEAGTPVWRDILRPEKRPSPTGSEPK